MSSFRKEKQRTRPEEEEVEEKEATPRDTRQGSEHNWGKGNLHKDLTSYSKNNRRGNEETRRATQDKYSVKKTEGRGGLRRKKEDWGDENNPRKSELHMGRTIRSSKKECDRNSFKDRQKQARLEEEEEEEA